jgi:uncharacterized membrane protein
VVVPGVTVTSTRAQAINARGQIVGRYIDSNGNHHGFLRSADGSTFTTIDPSITGFTNISKIAARSINARGEIVGRFLDSTNISHGFYRSMRGIYSTIDVPSSSFGTVIGTDARGINDAGQVVGSYFTSQSVNGVTVGIPHGFLRSADGTTFTQIDVSGALGTIPGGINDAGEIVGGYAVAPNSGTFFVPHGFTLSRGTFTTFDSPCGSAGAFARTINEPFAIVGADTATADLFDLAHEDGSPDGLSGFVMSADGSTFIPINFSGSVGTEARGINASGTIVGDYTTDGTDNHAFVATPG